MYVCYVCAGGTNAFDREAFEALVQRCDDMVAVEDATMEKRTVPLVRAHVT
jgi:hypothetical protein